jgi:LuxR family transcriptional regulator, quorum-sensing system regulator BjaR1
MINDDVYDFIARCDSYRSLELLFVDYATIVQSYGFHSFIFTGLPVHGDDVESYVIKNAWPDEWTNRYRDQRYFSKDPVSQWSLKQSKPFFWADARAGSLPTEEAAKIEGEAREFGLGEGIAFPMYDASSWQAVISLATPDRCDLDKKSIAALYLSSLYYKMSACDLLPGSTDRKAALSPREQEILQWISAGKSSWEVSVILNISEGTVTQHLAKIRGKMGVSNTTHAVATAIRNREIRP